MVLGGGANWRRWGNVVLREQYFGLSCYCPFGNFCLSRESGQCVTSLRFTKNLVLRPIDGYGITFWK